MDGLSLAANILAVVDIAVKVGSICHEYLNSLKEAKSDINRFLQQVQSYQPVLNHMQQLLQGPHGARLSASQDLKQTIEHSHLELVRIYDRLDRTLNSSMRNKTMSFFSSSTLKSPAIQASKFLSNYNDMDKSSQMFMTYLPILNQMLVKRGDSGIQSRSSSEKTAIIERFRHIVGSMIVLADPLSAESLSKILGVDLATVEMEFNKLRSVLNVPADPNEPVRLFHLSFRDFLVKGGNKVSHPFQVDEQKTHEALALKCLELLSRDNNLKEDICELGHPGMLRSDIEQSRISACIPPYIRYACLYWIHHLKRSGSEICEGSPVHVFLTVYLLNWLEVLSLLDRISESISMIDDLMSIVENLTGHQVSELLYGVKRVILSHRYIIDTAPLQLYSSVLLFSPQNSIVVKYYKHAIPEWIDLQPAVVKDWDPCLQTVEASAYLQSTIFSHDSSLMVSAVDYSVKIWCTNTGACIQELPIPNSDELRQSFSFTLIGLSFSSDGGLLYLATNNSQLFVWRTDTWEYERQISLSASNRTENSKRRPSDPFQITFSNGARFVSFEYVQGLEIYEVDTGKYLKAFETGENIRAMANSHDMSLLLIGPIKKPRDRFLCATLWRVHDETQLQLFIEFTSCAAFSQNSNLLVAKVDGALEMYGNEYKRVNHCVCWTDYERIVFSPDSKLLAGIGLTGIHVFEVDSLRCIRRFRKSTDDIFFFSNRVSFSHDSTLVLSSQGPRLSLWDLSCNRSIEPCDDDDEYDRVVDAYFSADFECIMCRRAKSCQILKAKTGVCLESIKAETFSIRHCPWAILADNHIKFWHRDEENGYRILKLPDEICQISERREELRLFLSQEFTLLAAIMSDGSIYVWESGTGVLILREKITERDISSVNIEFSPGSSLIALESRIIGGFETTIWRASTGKVLIDSKRTGFIGFSPDSTLALIRRRYSNDFLEILYTETGDVAYKLGKLSSSRYSNEYSFSQNCSILALSSSQFIEIWNLKTKSLVQCVQLGNYRRLGVFTSNNMCLVTDIGLVQLGTHLSPLLKVDMALEEDALLEVALHSARERTWSRQGLGFSLDFRWILWNEENILWIPVDHREERPDMSPSYPLNIWSPSRFTLRSAEGLTIIGFLVEKIPTSISKTLRLLP